ncbi:MAG: fibronectin type III domain-containing protein [Gaiellaceae bacterium]
MLIAAATIVTLIALFPAVAAGAPGAVGAQTATSTSSTVTVNRPAGVAAGDVLVGTVTSRVGAAVTISAPSGWTFVRRDTCVLPATQLTQALYYRVASSAEPASARWTLSKSASSSAAIAVYRGVEGTPVAHSGSAVPDTRYATAPSLTAAEAQTLVVGSFGRTSNTTVTIPAGSTSRYRVSSGGTPPASILGLDLVRATTGATGPITTTGASSSGCAIGQAIAFGPTDAPVGTAPTAPTSLRATGTTASSISIAWDASSDDTGISAYGLYRDGASAGSTTSTSATFSGLACGSSYTLGADAVDTAGNRSATSTINASTSACASPPPSGGTTLTLTNTFWRCSRPVRDYAVNGLPLRVVMLYTTNYRPPNGGGAVQLDAGCVGDGTTATDLILDVRGDGRTYGPGEDAVRVTNALPGASNLEIEGRADCGRRVGDAHADGIQVLGGTNITFRNFEVGNYDAGVATCQGAGGALFYSMTTRNTRVVGGKYIGCNHSLFAGNPQGSVSGALFRSGRTDGTDPACVGYAASEPCMGPELNRGVTVSGVTCQYWNRTLDRWDTR